MIKLEPCHCKEIEVGLIHHQDGGGSVRLTFRFPGDRYMATVFHDHVISLMDSGEDVWVALKKPIAKVET